MPDPTAVPRRYPTLDLLRLVAISMTVLMHTPSLATRVFFLKPFATALWLGVDLFMLISGWLLGGQLLREASRGSIQSGRFFVKRWLRTIPPYYAMLFVVFLHPSVDWPPPSDRVLAHLTFTQIYFPPNYYLPSWSLCVEEHFYLLLPLLVMLFMRRPKFSTVFGVVAGVELLSVLARISVYAAGTADLNVPVASHLRCDGLFIGLLLAWVHINRPALWEGLKPWLNASMLVGLVSFLAVMSSVGTAPNPWMYIGAATVGTWALTLIFVACVHDGSWASRISFPGLRYLGELTYAIYLVHNIIPHTWLGEGHTGQGGVQLIVWRLAVVLGCSMIVHHLVERPALQFRNYVLNNWKTDRTYKRHPRPSPGSEMQ